MDDPTSWLALIYALGGLAKAWLEVRKAGLGLREARERANAAAVSTTDTIADEEIKKFANKTIIPEAILAALQEDIGKAVQRFSAAIKDVGNTLPQIDEEQKIACAVICKHLNRIRDLNNEELPGAEFKELWQTFGCVRTR